MSETEPVRLTTPLSQEDVAALDAGDRVLLSGVVYAARDTAHRRLVEMLAAGDEPPIPLAGQAIYYMGPSPARPGRVIGSAGPTTSGRMDPYTPALLTAGVRATIGKGRRSDDVRRAMAEHGAVYLGLVGGVAALIARCVVACDVVALEELGPEAIRRLEFKDLPAFVVNDTRGRDLYEEATAGQTA
ncbi:MAG: FumA C-terminus/TtdB family hydratase beta subunit [Planctomycetota bacterium]